MSSATSLDRYEILLKKEFVIVKHYLIKNGHYCFIQNILFHTTNNWVITLTGRGLDHLIGQNATELGFLSAYGGGESPEELLELISKSIVSEIQLSLHEDGVIFELVKENLPLVPSDLLRRGFQDGKLTKEGVTVVITDFGPEQKRFVERLVEFIQVS